MRGILTDGLLGLACLAAASCMGCAASGTVAFGKDARAAIYTPPVCASSQAAPVAAGERKIVTVDRDGKIGPDDVVTTTTTEPAFAPVAEADPVQESKGAAVSETGAGVLRTLFGFGKAAVIGLGRVIFGLPL